ncbi:cell division site-positioning protein MapZ family protein [Streptococcus orisratti]|uniref:cell division site-positioning protein MapZ family protein n=1 Tax=Streptococcus orisratti TaxID=114652 RepID=UPI003D01D4CE
MSEDKKISDSEQESPSLDFEKAQNMTVGEAVRKDKELKAGITENDNVLDKYIKQHREEVASQKFETKLSDFEQLDTGSLDDFIRKQREELEKTGFFEPVKEAEMSEEIKESAEPDLTKTVIFEEPVIPEEKPTDFVDTPKEAEVNRLSVDSIGLDKDDEVAQPFYKRKGIIIGSLVALIVAIFGVAYAMNLLNGKSSQTEASSSTTQSTQSTSVDKTAKANKALFEDLYASFFTDDEQTKLKNSEFANLSKLEAALKKLEGTEYYDKLQSKYDSLSKQISAIQAVNGLFQSDAIVDGSKVSATVKSDANFDSLSSDTLNTGNASLDTLLQSVISDGRDQLAKATENAATSAPAETASVPATDNTQAAPQETTTPAVSGATSFGITNYDPAILQRQKSRVPYDDSAIADTSNSAWTFADGVLEKIIATSQARGYFTGNDFILEKVNIINGNGYYNMFKSDGTYLFSINCKTGYFVGNASGHSDSLDY